MTNGMANTKNPTLEMAAKYICNLRDGLCPMVVENYQCLSACGPDTQPWRCWINHFQTLVSAKETTSTRATHSPDFSSRFRPERMHRKTPRPTADHDW